MIRPKASSSIAAAAGREIDLDGAKAAEHVAARLLAGEVLAPTWDDESSRRGRSPGDVRLWPTEDLDQMLLRARLGGLRELEVLEVKSVPRDDFGYVNGGGETARPTHRVIVVSRQSWTIRGWIPVDVWRWEAPPGGQPCWYAHWSAVIVEDEP